jgi:hypothetical protein
MYSNRLLTAEALQSAVMPVLYSIPEDEVQNLSQNLFACCEERVKAEGIYLQH